MAENVYIGSLSKLYLQETSSNQLDSVSGSADTTQPGIATNCELRIDNKPNKYVECDGAVRYFEGAQDLILKAGSLVARGEFMSALIGADSLSSNTYTVTKYTQFLPRFTIHLELESGASQELHVRMSDCFFSAGTLTAKVNELVLQDVEIVGESLGTVSWNRVV